MPTSWEPSATSTRCQLGCSPLLLAATPEQCPTGTGNAHPAHGAVPRPSARPCLAGAPGELWCAANRAALGMGTGGKRLSKAVRQVRSGCRNQGCCLLPREPTEQAVLWIHYRLKHTPKEENTPKEGNLFWQQERVKFRLWMKTENSSSVFSHSHVLSGKW